MKTSIHIQNLKCGGCVQSITKQLISMEGVENLQINLEDNEVFFEYQNEPIIEEVKRQLKKMGYPEDTERNTLGLKAKSYVSCAMGKMS